jgi:hypothetical protein
MAIYEGLYENQIAADTLNLKMRPIGNVGAEVREKRGYSFNN